MPVSNPYCWLLMIFNALQLITFGRIYIKIHHENT